MKKAEVDIETAKSKIHILECWIGIISRRQETNKPMLEMELKQIQEEVAILAKCFSGKGR